MGKYINVNSQGESLPSRGKAQQLILDGAQVVPARFTENLICVVENGPFDAAAYAYSESEFDAFNDPSDYRPKTWLVHPLAAQLAE